MDRLALTIALGLATTWPLAAAADVVPGARLAGACAACHGPRGRSQGSIPAIAGMDQAAFRARMQAFRDGQGTIMNRVVSAYDDAQLHQLARYFAAQSPADADTDDPDP